MNRVRSYYWICLGLAIGAGVCSLQCKRSAPNADRVQISYNLCLQAGTFHLAQDTARQRFYVEHFLLDTTQQFFSKMLTNEQKDTLYVSVFNSLPLRGTVLLLTQNAAPLIEQTFGKVEDTVNYYSVIAKQKSYFLLRYLVRDPETKGVTMLDLHSQDSVAVQQLFQEQTLLKLIQKCI